MLNFFISLIIYMILIILQFVLPTYISFNGIYPNFILIFIVFIAINKGPMKGQLTGFLYGLTWDFLSTDIFGLKTLAFTISGYLAGQFNRKLNKEQPLTQIIVTGICLIITHALTSLVHMIMPEEIISSPFELTHFVWISIILNLALTPFIFKLLASIRKKYRSY